MNDTIVSHNSFPEGSWGGPFTKLDEPAWASSSRTFYTVNGIAVNATLRYRNNDLAREKYTSRLNGFRNEPVWYTPPEVGFESQVANEFFFACYGPEYRLGRSCQAIGLYEEYFILLSVNMLDDSPEYELLENLLWEIDERMARRLGGVGKWRRPEPG